MTGPDSLPPVFLDVEASGIARGSFPVEIGWASPRILADGRVELEPRSLLVRPTGDWLRNEAAWDRGAEAAHGLDREVLLRLGTPVGAVCDALDAAFAGRRIGSDTGAGGWDDNWIDALYEAAGRGRRDWRLSEQASGALVARRAREAGLVPRFVRPPLAPLAPAATHAAAEDALPFAWEWGMVHLLAATGLPAMTEPEMLAALGNVRALLPESSWPRIAPGAEDRFRRRHRDGPEAAVHTDGDL